MNLFALNTVKHVAGLQKSRYIEPKFEPELQDHFLKYNNDKQLAIDIGRPTKGSRYFVILSGNFIFGDFIEALIVENEIDAEEMTLSTLSMSMENIDSLAGMMDQGYIQSMNLIVSDFFYSHERSGMVPELYEKLDKDNRFQLAVAGVHTKICLIRTSGGNKIVIHGSANLRTSSNIEQIMIENHDALYDFNYEIHSSITKRYATINKSLRRNELWRAVLQDGNPPTRQGQEHLTSMGQNQLRQKGGRREGHRKILA